MKKGDFLIKYNVAAFTDSGNGSHAVYGKIRKPNPVVGQPRLELDWHRGVSVSFPSNDPELYTKSHTAVLAQIQELNPEIVFVIE